LIKVNSKTADHLEMKFLNAKGNLSKGISLNDNLKFRTVLNTLRTNMNRVYIIFAMSILWYVGTV